KAVGDLSIGQLQIVVLEDGASLYLLENHSDESAGGDRRIDGAEGSVGGALLDVLADVIFHFASSRIKEDAGQLVTFEGAEQQQSHEGLVFGVEIEHF